MFTRRSRASTFQTTSARLSKNCTMVISASDTSFLDTLRPRDMVRSEGVAAFVFWFFAHDRYPHPGNCIGRLSNIGLLLSTGNKYLFLLHRHSIPYDF